MEDIMDLVDENEDYKMKDRILQMKNKKMKKVFQYEINEKVTITTISCDGGGATYKYLCVIPIGDIKKGGISRVKNLLKKAIQKIYGLRCPAENINDKVVADDEYTVLDTETTFSITIEITYKEEITEWG